ncbi:MAG: transglycosylase SLT domain-containing protein, partial [Bacteroidota bacterium]
ALNPMARSRSGAVGLWQFMKPTGRENGLRINSAVDERRDPHKSTKAAIKYLHKQYKRYGNWELALAAYNGGPGRVNRAIKRGRSKNFWRIQRYLPRETRNYVPAFIAATYVVNYYHLHDLHPVYPALELQLTQKIKVYDRISFFEIANITGASIETIQKLNPSYKRKYIPANRRGSNLVLPQNNMYSMLDYLGRPDSEIKTIASSPIPAPIDKEWEKQQIKTMHTVQTHDNLESVAQYYGCTTKDLKHWNQLTSDYVASGQQLAIYVPKSNDAHRYYLIQQLPTLGMDPLSNPIRLPSLKNKFKAKRRFSTTAKRTFIPKFDHNRASKHKKHIFHALKRNETLLDVIGLYPGIDLEHIMELNDIKDLKQLKPGTVLLIK